MSYAYRPNYTVVVSAKALQVDLEMVHGKKYLTGARRGVEPFRR